ncbi:hypothetical protein PFISCL1PPCAC_25352, partial [Pristionchus fissidentatus]
MARLRPMWIAFFAVLIVVVVVGIVLAVTLTQPTTDTNQYLTVSLYVGDADNKPNARRKRGTDDCLSLEQIKATVTQSLTQLESSVNQVRVIQYTETSTSSPYMEPAVAINYIANNVKQLKGNPSQASSLTEFKGTRK